MSAPSDYFGIFACLWVQAADSGREKKKKKIQEIHSEIGLALSSIFSFFFSFLLLFFFPVSLQVSFSESSGAVPSLLGKEETEWAMFIHLAQDWKVNGTF